MLLISLAASAVGLRLFHFDPLGGVFREARPDSPSRFLARSARGVAVEHALDLRYALRPDGAPSRSSQAILRAIGSRVKRRGVLAAEEGGAKVRRLTGKSLRVEVVQKHVPHREAASA